MEQGALYLCFSCKDPYYGGPNDYEASMREQVDEENFLC